MFLKRIGLTGHNGVDVRSNVMVARSIDQENAQYRGSVMETIRNPSNATFKHAVSRLNMKVGIIKVVFSEKNRMVSMVKMF